MTGLGSSAPYQSEPGHLRTEFGAVGPHEVVQTREAVDCNGPVATIYGMVLKYANGVNEQPPCWGLLPFGGDPAFVGYDFVYPKDLSEPAPHILLSPGLGADPGLLQRQAERYASHGYVVTVCYASLNWFGSQVALGAAGAKAANEDPEHPLHGLINLDNTVLVGHSAGGGSVVRMGELLNDVVTVKGIVGVNPGPSDFGLHSPTTTRPTLIIVAEHESLVPHGITDFVYNNMAAGPKWMATVNGSYHGTYNDNPDLNAYAALVLSFAEYTLTGSERSAVVYEGGLLEQDLELSDVVKENVSN